MALSPATNQLNMMRIHSPQFRSGASPSPNRLNQWKHGTTPPWKDTFKARCMNRMKTSRERFLNRMRKIDDTEGNGENVAPPGAAKVMEIEFQNMKQEQKWSKDQELSAYQQICEELQSEIERAEQEYAEEMMRENEEALKAQIAAYELAHPPGSPSGPIVIEKEDGSLVVEDQRRIPCPSCFHQSLTVRYDEGTPAGIGGITSHIIVCVRPECGLTVVPQDQAVCNLDYVYSVLCDTVNEHAAAGTQGVNAFGSPCSNAHLKYYTKSFMTSVCGDNQQLPYQHLIARCTNCSYLKVVL